MVLAHWADRAMPPSYLIRPLLAAALIAVVVGAVSWPAGRFAVPVSAALAAGIAAMSLWVVLGAAVVALVVLVARMLGRPVEVSKALTVGAVVFLVGGIVRVVPLLSWPMSTAEAAESVGGPPTFVVLLDGYPRPDTLASLGIDVSPFLDDLAGRGFTHYPDAYTTEGWTHHTLTTVFGGTPTEDVFGSGAQRRAAKGSWHLPADFAYIAPPIGHVTIPGARQIGPDGLTNFEIDLLRRSALGRVDWVGELVMDGLRDRLDSSLDLLAETEERRVFAHLLAPHTPFLYGADGEPMPAPGCWPGCEIFDIDVDRLGITLDEWAAGAAGYLEYLNGRIIEAVDAIIARHPDAVVVLFSDHGGRYTYTEPEEWRRSFLTTRGVGLDDPTPASLGQVLTLK